MYSNRAVNKFNNQTDCSIKVYWSFLLHEHKKAFFASAFNS